MNLLDEDGSGGVDLDELLNSVHLVFPIIQEPGEDLIDFLTDEFYDIDFDDSGFQEKEELCILFNKICCKEDFKVCEHWMIDYILEQIDIDGNGKLDLEEVIHNYRQVL